MKFHSLLLPALAVGGALLLLPPQAAIGFTTIGGQLGLTQRDVRVFNNFTDATANNNNTPDANFPGYQGVSMACWKAAVEWGSGLHGNGNGDPHQNGGLGSGGANFDPSWQGNATAIGGGNDNVISEIPGSSGGVLAYTETPINDGWRMRFYAGWTWDDGPGTSTGGNMDIQGVACHEYGHALGLGHSSTSGATMFPTISGTGVGQRSIATDDINGVKSIYGVKSATKPTVTGATQVAGVVTITGSNFSPTGNEVWFTQKATGGTGNPIKVTGLASTGGGTQITVTSPTTAGKGDLLVRNSVGASGADLSNAWPIDPGSANPSGPNILSTTPSSLDIVSPDGQTVVLTGTGFTGVNSVTVNGSPLAVGSYAVNNDTQMSINWPLLTSFGDINVVITNSLGSDSTQVSVNPCDPPVIDVNPSAPFLALNGQPVTITAGSEVGDVMWLVYSTSNVPSTLPGVVDMGLGAGFTSYGVLKVAVVPPQGWFQYTFTPTGVPAGTTAYFVGLAYPSETLDLTEDSDPVQALTILF